MIGSIEVVSALQKSATNSVHFEVVYSGMGFSSSFGSKNMLQALRYFHRLYVDSIVMSSDSIMLSGKMNLPYLTANGTLWLNINSVVSEESYRVFLSRLLDDLGTAPIRLVATELDECLLTALVSQETKVSSLSLLNHQYSKNVLHTRDAFYKFLCSNAEYLEFIQLRQRLTSVPLQSLQKCTNLQVLSVTSLKITSPYRAKDQGPISAAQVFLTLQHLQCLEYFEWSEMLNIFTKDVLALYDLLSNHIPKLLHWHWKLCHLVLFTTDLENTMFEPLNSILRILLAEKTATSWCETYKFALDNHHIIHWLESIRPQVSFATTVGACPPFP